MSDLHITILDDGVVYDTETVLLITPYHFKLVNNRTKQPTYSKEWWSELATMYDEECKVNQSKLCSSIPHQQALTKYIKDHIEISETR